jgi:hypothetical protein
MTSTRRCKPITPHKQKMAEKKYARQQSRWVQAARIRLNRSDHLEGKPGYYNGRSITTRYVFLNADHRL